MAASSSLGSIAQSFEKPGYFPCYMYDIVHGREEAYIREGSRKTFLEILSLRRAFVEESLCLTRAYV